MAEFRRGRWFGSNRMATSRNLASTAVRASWKVNTTGAENVPLQGTIVLAANHCGLLDGPLLFSVAPRPVHLLAPEAAFVAPFDRLLTEVGQLGVDPDVPDREGLHNAVRVLNEGGAVGLFPEGHRGRGDSARVQSSWAYLVGHTQARVVPVAILGTRGGTAHRDSLPRARSRIEVSFGPALTPPSIDPSSQASLRAGSEWLRQRLSDHVHAAVALTGLDLPEDGPRD